jgi:hypothetical protein
MTSRPPSNPQGGLHRTRTRVISLDFRFGLGAAVPAASADRPVLPLIADILLHCREPRQWAQ